MDKEKAMTPTKTFPLKRPIVTTFNAGKPDERKEELTELTLRTHLTARDLRVTDGHPGEVAKAIAMIAHLSGQPVRIIDELHPDDFATIGQALEDF